MTKPTENAFPIVLPVADDFSLEYGLSKREYFAALALQGILANPTTNLERASKEIHADIPYWAEDAIAAADALISQLSPKPDEEPNIEEFSVPIPGDPDYDAPQEVFDR